MSLPQTVRWDNERPLVAHGKAYAAPEMSEPSTPDPQGSTAPPQAVASLPGDPLVPLNLPVTLNGRYLGDIDAKVSQQGAALVRAERLALLANDAIDGSPGDAIAAASDAEGYVDLARLSVQGVEIAFDMAALEIALRTAGDRVTPDGYSLRRYAAPDPQSFEKPRPIAVGTKLALVQSFIAEGDDTGRLPLVLDIDGIANLGGFDGINLAYQLAVQEEGDVLARRNMLLFHDEYDIATRFGIGDLQPTATGFQSSPRIGGLTVERRYDLIQPFSNIRQSGRQSFVLERTSQVQIEVNGALVQSIALPPGTYDLTDFPFADGANDVRVFVEDATGRREVGSFSLFVDPQLLGEGESVYALNIGVLEDVGGSDSIEYSGDAAGSGFLEYGVTDWLTLGLNAQGAEEQQVLGARAVLATDYGAVLLDVAGSRSDDLGDGLALALDYRYDLDAETVGEWLETPIELNLGLRHYEDDFFALGEAPGDLDVETEGLVRLQTRLPWDVGMTLAGRHTSFRNDREDELRTDLSLARAFGPVLASATMTLIDRDETDIGGFLSLTYNFGGPYAARASHDSLSERSRIEVERYQQTDVGDLSGRFGVTRLAEDTSAEADLRYFGNRFEGRFNHVGVLDEKGDVEQVATVSLVSGIGITDEGVAFGRDPSEGFAILPVHSTLDDADVAVQSRFTSGVTVHDDGLGPMLVPIGRAYTPDQLRLDIANVPLGYDVGAARLDLLPGAGSGYHLAVGSDASRSMLGVLLASGGEPLALRTGRAVALGDGETRPFFTNRAGRFLVDGLAPDTYRLEVDGLAATAEVIVPESQAGVVKLGEVRLGP